MKRKKTRLKTSQLYLEGTTRRALYTEGKKRRKGRGREDRRHSFINFFTKTSKEKMRKRKRGKKDLSHPPPFFFFPSLKPSRGK